MRIFLFVVDVIRQYGMAAIFYGIAGTVIFRLTRLVSVEPGLALALGRF
ncbi:hypothetical protein [Xenorhabdus sp. PB62.4]|nr:hypothetical protein [Xenorhabdus sp. PB62.4]